MPRVLIVRGHLVTPWELRPWAELPERYDVSYLLTRSNEFDAGALPLRAEPVTALRDRLPRGRLGAAVAAVLGERYFADADAAYALADIVHAEELSFWFAADAARRKARHPYRLVLTVWETLPLLLTFRNWHVRRYRQEVLAATDLFLAATERARESLRAQLHSAQRMIDAVQDARTQLRLLDARLDEAVTRAVELSLRSAGDADVSGLGSDVESLVSDMEALRAALEDVDRPDPGGTTATA